jgi:O-antigen ligase
VTYLLLAAGIVVTLLSAVDLALARPASIALLSLITGGLAITLPSCRPPVAWICLLATATAGTVQLAAGSASDPPAAALELTEWFSLASLYVASVTLFESTVERRRFLQFFLLAAGLLAAFAIVQPYAAHLGMDKLAASADESVGPFPSRNAYASFVLLAFPVAVWAANKLGTEWWLAAGVLLTSAFMTGSRAGAALVLFEAVFLSIWMKRRVWIAPLAATAMVGLLWGGNSLGVRLGYQDPLQHRREVYAASLELIRARPLLGWGLGSFEQVYPTQARFDAATIINHAHNDWIEAAVEGGLVYAAAVLGCVFVLLWPARRSIWALGLPAVVVHSVVDFPFQRLGVTVWFILIAAAAQSNVEVRPVAPKGRFIRL